MTTERDISDHAWLSFAGLVEGEDGIQLVSAAAACAQYFVRFRRPASPRWLGVALAECIGTPIMFLPEGANFTATEHNLAQRYAWVKTVVAKVNSQMFSMLAPEDVEYRCRNEDQEARNWSAARGAVKNLFKKE